MSKSTENYLVEKQVSIRTEVQPVKLNLNKDILNFFVEFLNGLDLQQAEAEAEFDLEEARDEVPVIIKEFYIMETSVNLSYSSNEF